MPSGPEALPENAVISAGSLQYIPDFMCLSGTNMSNVGQLIGVDGLDITHRAGDNLHIQLGNATSPGMVKVFHSRMSSAQQGVYTCRLPDETGDTADFNIGLYMESFNGKS